MSLFLSTSSLNNQYSDCISLNVSETIERDCLSVLHKLHDQVNGLQLVQVVVQPLARLFNPAGLAALVANVSSSPNSGSQSSQNVTTPTSQHSLSGSHHNHDLDGVSITTTATSTSTLGSSTGHARTQSFASTFNSNFASNNNNSLQPATSTYMMSPDTAQALIARLDTDRDVNWLMEIIGYGLSMPFSLTGEQDSVKDCCTIYCEWLTSALLPYNQHNEDKKYQQLSKLVPVPIKKDPNRYARKMLSHLYNVFLPRQPLPGSQSVANQKDQATAQLTAVSRQAVLCHRVLRTIENIAQNRANLLDNHTWDHILALLLTVNEKLLSGPTEPDDIGTQLQDRILGVLFELMVLASAKSIPTPALWKTFNEKCMNWRHRPALVEHWRKINLLITKKLVKTPRHLVEPSHRYDEESLHAHTQATTSAIEAAIAYMNYDALAQTWYRFLNLIGNPVELTDPEIISKTDVFQHSACVSNNVLDPRQHPCLNVLPQIFLTSMISLKEIVDTFSGLSSGNSILHVFGDWLFSAALVGSDLNQEASRQEDDEKSNYQSSSHITLENPLTADSFEAGQSEAMSILCKIFSSKTSTEEISPKYLSRFYLCLKHCLSFGIGNVTKRQLLASVLTNSTSLLQRDLDGMNLLIPSFITAIEFVFERETPVRPPPRQHNRSGSVVNPVNDYDLRRACILTLLNLLVYPYYFQDLAIRSCLNKAPTTTFGSLRPTLLKLLFVALQTETDPTNMQILFGGLSLTVHDLASNVNKSCDSPRSSRKAESGSFQEGGDGIGDSLDLANKQDDTASQNSFVFNSSGGFIVKSLHVTCHLLINIWKHDTQVSLAALELLTTIARLSTAPGLNTTETHYLPSRQRSRNNNNDLFEMKGEYKQTTKWICDYICNQCSRPPPAHSRDMHSTIVAAYQCLSVWFYNHPYMLNDESCISTLMEVIELGVSGQKSKTVNSNSASGTASKVVTYKADKVMKPSSMRVREAAESLLNICMVRARTESEEESMSSYDTVLNEHSLIEMFGSPQYRNNLHQLHDPETMHLAVYRQFKYFSDEDSIIFGFLEGLSHEQATRDSVICLLRTPFGKHCWKMKFNYYSDKSRDKVLANKTLGLIKRPFQQCNMLTSDKRLFTFPAGQNKSLYFNNSAKFFPDCIESLQLSGLDKLVTTLDDYMNNQDASAKLKNDLDKISKIFNHQVLAEQKVTSECSMRIKRADCEEPQPHNDLETARMLVSHLGLNSNLCSIVDGGKVSSSFVADLKSLDQQPVRTCDSVSIFYVRKNRTSPREILESVRERHNISLKFFEWIMELGEPTVVKYHSRWTGKLSNSWINSSIIHRDVQLDSLYENQLRLSRNQMLTADHGGAIFDGDRMTLYWSDMCQELAFLVPHRIERSGSNVTPVNADNQSHQSNLQTPSESELVIKDLDSQSISSSAANDNSSQSTRTPSQQGSPRETSFRYKDQKDNTSLSRQSISTQRRKTINSSSSIGCDTNFIICWLECPDDIQDVQCEALLSISEYGYLSEDGFYPTDTSNTGRPKPRDYVKYFISPMRNGLYRINLATSFGRQWLALPLIDGMTLSKGVLSSLVRESVLNLCRRRRLDADSYLPPHIKRRLKLQDICNNYKISSRYESSEFYNNLFRSKLT